MKPSTIQYDCNIAPHTEASNKVPRNSNGIMTFQVSAESRESRLNTMVSESVAMIDAPELDGKREAEKYVAKMSKAG